MGWLVGLVLDSPGVQSTPATGLCLMTAVLRVSEAVVGGGEIPQLADYDEKKKK